jgi:sugar O-acyltransferase (sialic acid O-acetyltransferase NeuD family)
MSKPDNLIIIGAGGAGVEALWVARRMHAARGGADFATFIFVDDNPAMTGKVIEGVAVRGTLDQFLKTEMAAVARFHCSIGSNRQRRRVAGICEARGLTAVSLIDPTAVVAESAQVGIGTYIGPLSVVAPHAVVGRHVLINTHVGVGHHAVIGDFAQLCPGVRVNGGCKVDTGAFLGSNATVHPGLTIGEGATIGANSFVIRSVKPRFSMLGVPARIVSRPAENGPDAQA